jgi:hypothetical protein
MVVGGRGVERSASCHAGDQATGCTMLTRAGQKIFISLLVTVTGSTLPLLRAGKPIVFCESDI